MSTAVTLTKPEPTEYAAYYERYISLISANDILAELRRQEGELSALLSGRPEKDGGFRYATDKWTINELVGHLTDTERIFAYRALRIARGDTTPIEGFEQDDYVRNGPFPHCRLADLLEEFRNVRAATLSLFRNLQPEAWTRRGTANQNEVSVRALAYIIAGHTRHHQRILEEKYLSALI